MKIDYYKMTRDFLLNEGQVAPSVNSYIQSMAEMLDKLSPRNLADARRIELAKENVLNIRRHVRRLEEKNQELEESKKQLEEQLHLLQEQEK